MANPTAGDPFTALEAQALLGKTFESLVSLGGVPKGTRGKLIDLEGSSNLGFEVVIEWELKPATRYLRRWLTKNELGQFTREVEPTTLQR